jgi:FixJ family two-component response regulator
MNATNPAPTSPGIVHVVDDDRAFRTAMGRLLAAAGHEPRLYGSASEYLAADDSQGPACVLLDLRMPGATGLELQHALATRPHTHPVIFLSGHGDIPSTVRAMQEGAMDFLTKPVATPTLRDARPSTSTRSAPATTRSPRASARSCRASSRDGSTSRSAGRCTRPSARSRRTARA